MPQKAIEQKTEVKTYRVRAVCPECKKSELELLPHRFDVINDGYDHYCYQCQLVTVLDKIYPYIIHE